MSVHVVFPILASLNQCLPSPVVRRRVQSRHWALSGRSLGAGVARPGQRPSFQHLNSIHLMHNERIPLTSSVAAAPEYVLARRLISLPEPGSLAYLGQQCCLELSAL
jgi:hypothetical protein